jgi:hypothetical protein
MDEEKHRTQSEVGNVERVSYNGQLAFRETFFKLSRKSDDLDGSEVAMCCAFECTCELRDKTCVKKYPKKRIESPGAATIARYSQMRI